MENSDFGKDPLSNPKICNQHSRRTSLRSKDLRTEALGQESLSQDCELVDSRALCSCGNVLKKRQGKYCCICKMDLKVMAKYPSLKLRLFKVHLVDRAASCDAEFKNHSRNLEPLCLRGKTCLETKRFPKKRDSKIVENKSRAAKREFGNPYIRKRNSDVPMKTCGTMSKHQVSIKKINELSCYSSKKVIREICQGANSGKKDTKVAVTKKRKNIKAQKTSSLENVKHRTVRRKKSNIKKSRINTNCSGASLHVCSVCGVTSDTYVGKLVHEFHHKNKEASIVLSKCDGSRFAQVCILSDESVEPSSKVCLPDSPKVENEVSIPINTEFSTEHSEFSRCCKLGIDSQIYSPKLKECSTISVLEDSADSEVALLTELVLGTGSAIQPVNCRNNENSWNEKCDIHTTDVRLISSCKSVTKSNNSTNFASLLVEPAIPTSVDELASSGCTSISVDDRDESFHTISSSVNMSKDQSNSELLVDDESGEERMDTKTEMSMNFESSCSNSPLLVIGNRRNAVSLGNTGDEYEAAGTVPIKTDQTTTLDGSGGTLQEVEDMSEIVEVAKFSIPEETSSCSLSQKTCGNGTVCPDECPEEEMDISDTDSNRAICGDDSGVNFLNEGTPDQTENNKHIATLEQLDFPLQELEGDVNLPSHRILNTEDDTPTIGKKFKCVSVSRDDGYHKHTSDMTKPTSMEYSETFSGVEVQLPLVSPHLVTGESQELDCPVASTVSEDLENFASWTDSRVAATNRDVLHAVISRGNCTLESTSEDSEQSEASVIH